MCGKAGMVGVRTARLVRNESLWDAERVWLQMQTQGPVNGALSAHWSGITEDEEGNTQHHNIDAWLEGPCHSGRWCTYGST